MSIQSYAVGFTKVAEAAGIDPEDLLDYMQKRADVEEDNDEEDQSDNPGFFNKAKGYVSSHKGLVGGAAAASSAALASLLIARAMRNKKKKQRA